MSITNWGELKTALTRYLKREDLTDLYQQWQEFTLSRLNQDCRLPEQEFRSTATANAQYLALPLDFVEARNIQVTGAGGAYPLTYLSPEAIDNYSRVDKDQPIKTYTIFNGQLELIPAPASNSTTEIEIFYFAKMVPFINDSDTNLMLQSYPQLFLYALMVEAMPFMEHEKGTQAWDVMYRDMVRLLNTRADAGRFSGNSLHMRAV